MTEVTTSPAAATSSTTTSSDGTSPAATSSDGIVSMWVGALAEFERAVRAGDDFSPPQGLGPMPVELREHAEQLLAACLARVDAIQAEMDQVDDELHGLRRVSARTSWADDARGAASGAAHVV